MSHLNVNRTYAYQGFHLVSETSLSHNNFFFFFFQNLVSFSKHRSLFQPMKKLKWCFLLPKLTTEEPEQYLGKKAERSPLLSVSDLAERMCSLHWPSCFLPTARPNHLPCLGVALHTIQECWFCVCVCARARVLIHSVMSDLSFCNPLDCSPGEGIGTPL